MDCAESVKGPAWVRRSVARCAPQLAMAPSSVRDGADRSRRRRPASPKWASCSAGSSERSSKRWMKMCAGLTSISGLAGAGEFVRGDPIDFFAEKMGGAAAISPRKWVARVRSSRQGEGREGCGSAAGVPSASKVSVAKPKRMVPSYDLSAVAKNCARRVYLPSSSGSTPVAMGSRVPRWPMERSPVARRMMSTTSCEVSPAGLSSDQESIQSCVSAFAHIRACLGDCILAGRLEKIVLPDGPTARGAVTS